MGLIRDAVRSTIGSGQINNGFNGPQLPFTQQKSNQQQPYSSSAARNGARPSYSCRREYPDDNLSQYGQDYNNDRYQSFGYGPGQSAPNRTQLDSQTSVQSSRNFASAKAPSCYALARPLVLPQINYGDGQPFLRAYSYELEQCGIPESIFTELIDAINVAIVPNPEAQIFQKAAKIAGWFIPGSASLGLMGGQVAVGVATAAGHQSMIARVLSKANLEVFHPVGLEIGIGKTNNVNDLLGMSASQFDGPVSPTDQLYSYGTMVAPLSSQYAPLQNSGRQDPTAAVGRNLATQNAQTKLGKAQENMAKGKYKDANNLESGLKWLIVRQI